MCLIFHFSLLVHAIDNVLEGWNDLFPSWVVLWEGVDGEDFCQLDDVHDLEFLKLEIGVESTVVELTEESH